MYKRSAEGEARRLEALRSPEVRKKISLGLKGKKPKNFHEMQKLSWEASKKDVLTYSGIHAWVRRSWGKANCCELCGKDGLTGRSVHWANKDHKYTRERIDWMMVCRPCHAKWDQEHGQVCFTKKSVISMPHCKHGHEINAVNTQYTERGFRRCRVCAREKAKRHRDKLKACES